MNTLLTTLVQIICNCFDLCLRTTALACGGIEAFHPIDTQLLVHWRPAVFKQYRDVQSAYRNAQDPYPELGDKKVTTAIDSLTYADVRKIVDFYSNYHPHLQPNTVDALMWAQKQSFISVSQFDGFMLVWTRPC